MGKWTDEIRLMRDAFDGYPVVNPSLSYEPRPEVAAGKFIAGLYVKCISKYGDTTEARRFFWQAVKDGLDTLHNGNSGLLDDKGYESDLAIIKEIFS